MVDIGRVSQNVKDLFNDIASKDGKKGISNQEERNALADLLSSGKVSGKHNVDYIQCEINNFDLNEAAKNVSDFVRNAINKAKEMAGDKNAIDDVLELAVLDTIIDNASGDYSPEDVQYAKLLKAQSQYAGQKSHETVLKEENAALLERNAELMKENEALKMELENTKQQAKEADAKLDEALTEIDDSKIDLAGDAIKSAAVATVKGMAASLKNSLMSIMNLSSETVKIIADVENKQKITSEGKLSKTTFGNFVKQAENKIEENNKKIAAEKEKVKTDSKKMSDILQKAGITGANAGITGLFSGIFEEVGAAGASAVDEVSARED